MNKKVTEMTEDAAELELKEVENEKSFLLLLKGKAMDAYPGLSGKKDSG